MSNPFSCKRISIVTMAISLASSLTAQTASNMSALSAEKKANAIAIKLTGKLSTEGNSDFRQLRDLCWQLKEADLSQSDCAAIPKNAFHSRHQLRHVILPNALRSIGTQAFFACDNLQEIVLPKSLETVGKAAFSGCHKIKNMVIEGSPQLKEYAFARLSSLKSIKALSKQPPKAVASTFYGIDFSACELTVPKGSESKYRKAEGWSQFYTAKDKQAREVCNPAACLIPVPLTMDTKAGKPLEVKGNWTILASPSLGNEQAHASRIIHTRVGQAKSKKSLILKMGIDSSLGDPEAYTIAISRHEVSIKGCSNAGVFYALMTFDQLLRGNGSKDCCDAIPQLTITDSPRTHIRELMVDPARIFIPYEALKAFIPEMARYKLNAIHLHLVDDQAWRMEIKKYPRLTAEASQRWNQDDMLMPIKGYYTQEEMKDFVAYAAQYHVQVIPEIEMPGHEVAAISVYPELTCLGRQVPIRTTCGVSDELLCPGNEFTYEFLGNVFKELADIFPSQYIHLGGDEAGNPALDCWTDCPKCQALKKKLGITSTDRSENWRLQGYLFDRIIDTLKTKCHKTPMFWYETDFKKIQSGCVTFAWRDGLTQKAIDAAVSNNALIMLCPGEHCYFDYPMAKGDMPEVNWGMPTTTLKQTYDLDPSWGMGEAFEKNNLFGVAGTLWSECINSPERIYYQAYPRALALAEVGWSQGKNRSWEGFKIRLKPTLEDMMRRGVTFSMEY